MEVSYGITVQPKDDIFLETAERALKSVSDATAPGKFLVDLIPAMKYIPEWFPGAYFQRQATIWRKMKDELLDLPYDHVKQAMVRISPLLFLKPCRVKFVDSEFRQLAMLFLACLPL